MRVYRLRVEIERKEEGKNYYESTADHLMYCTKDSPDFTVINDLFQAIKGVLFYWRIP